jgi:hypothetical protein
MLYLTTYDAVKRLNAERISRALAKAEPPIDRYVKSREFAEADIIELKFGAHCDEPAIGA